MARIEQLDGRPGRARKHVEKALESEPENPGLRKLLIDTLLAENDLDRAAEELAALPPSVRDQPGVALVAGRIAMSRGRPGDAEQSFQKVFDADPTVNTNLLRLTEAMWAQGKRDEAVARLEAWIKKRPDDHATRNHLATRHLLMGNESAARKHYEALLVAVPDNPLVLNNLAWLYRERSPETALEHIKRANDLAPDSPQILDTYAMVQRTLGNQGEALSLSERAMSADDEVGPDVRFHRALILVDARRNAEAENILEQLIAGPVFEQQAEAEELLDRIR